LCKHACLAARRRIGEPEMRSLRCRSSDQEILRSCTPQVCVTAAIHTRCTAEARTHQHILSQPLACAIDTCHTEHPSRIHGVHFSEHTCWHRCCQSICALTKLSTCIAERFNGGHGALQIMWQCMVVTGLHVGRAAPSIGAPWKADCLAVCSCKISVTRW
jgi:hypothetical protein